MDHQGATKEDVRQIIHSEVLALREDVIKPIQRDLRTLHHEIYGETGRNGIKTRVKENTTLRGHVYWLWGAMVSAILVGAVTAYFGG